jgi:hypothetical protein
MANRPKKIRVWKLGNPVTGEMPSDERINKLEEILNKITNPEQIMNIVWGPDLVVEEYDI